MSSLARCIYYPPEEELLAKCLDLGLVMRNSGNIISHPPITLEPFSISRDVFRVLQKRQLLWNSAVDRAARHPCFLKSTLEATAKSDKAFTGRLFQMYQSIYLDSYENNVTGKSVNHPHIEENARTEWKERPFQPVMLGIFRTDYMCSKETNDFHEKEKNGGNTHDRLAVSSSSPSQWKNVEINTISVSFAGLSPLVSQFHRYIRAYHSAQRRLDRQLSSAENEKELGKLEYSTSDVEIPRALNQAFRAWEVSVDPFYTLLQQYFSNESSQKEKVALGNTPPVKSSETLPSSSRPPLVPVVVVVVQEGERNTGDQYKLLLRLLEKEGRMHIRRTLQSLHQSMTLVSIKDILQLFSSPSSSRAFDTSTPRTSLLPPPFAVIEGKYVASVVYFRSCYTPNDFLSEDCWAAREALERCNAVKCPSLPFHLMTWKKVQQRFTDVEGVLQPIAFRGCRKEAEELASHFVAQFALNKDEGNPFLGSSMKVLQDSSDSSSVKESSAVVPPSAPIKVEDLIQDAIAHPHRYVLKPQLEGGGNLFAGEKMRDLLISATLETNPEMYYKVRREFILMERIDFPLRHVGYFQQEKLRLAIPMSSELGIFGIILSDGSSEEAPKTCKREDIDTVECRRDCDSLFFNAYAGCVVRSKPEGEDDGGVMAGVACLDSLSII